MTSKEKGGACLIHGAYRCFDHCPYCPAVPEAASTEGATACDCIHGNFCMAKQGTLIPSFYCRLTTGPKAAAPIAPATATRRDWSQPHLQALNYLNNCVLDEVEVSTARLREILDVPTAKPSAEGDGWNYDVSGHTSESCGYGGQVQIAFLMGGEAFVTVGRFDCGHWEHAHGRFRDDQTVYAWTKLRKAPPLPAPPSGQASTAEEQS